MMRPVLILACLPLWSCTQFPELDAVQTPGVENAPYPALLPIDTLIGNPGTRIAPDEATSVQERADTLRARAARLRQIEAGPPEIDDRASGLRDRAATLETQ